MKNRLTSLLIITGIIVVTAGCASFTAKINRLSISMSKDEVRTLVGNNFQAKASKVDEKGNILDLWEIYDEKSKTRYQIFFLNGKVSQWGKSEDLQAFPQLNSPKYLP
ncbi:MAG: hypothetical protein KJ893_00715 [Candidatus Omnitrophica bacterium]|nr:hypothetical protein [Candidatus Omnitrophota bacterium]MBU4479553.1 hypothetical protein [Candidatus Omnitrophota bacterium]MCG2704415.1 hypothetical protein [Candidatus Omnitrophota bacterium]